MFIEYLDCITKVWPVPVIAAIKNASPISGKFDFFITLLFREEKIQI